MGEDRRLCGADGSRSAVLKTARDTLEHDDFGFTVHSGCARKGCDIVRRARRGTHILVQKVTVVRGEVRDVRSGASDSTYELIAREDGRAALEL